MCTLELFWRKWKGIRASLPVTRSAFSVHSISVSLIRFFCFPDISEIPGKVFLTYGNLLYTMTFRDFQEKLLMYI